MPEPRAATMRRFWFKAVVFALLGCNTGYYLFTGTANEGFDSLAWLTLLALFELESGHTEINGARRVRTAIRFTRLAAAGALVAVLLGYARAREWLDAVNVGLWIMVVGVFELEMRHPDLVRQAPGKYAAPILYTGLGALVIAWLLRGDWFDAYDAALWLTAFATVELDLLDRFDGGRVAT